MRFRRRAILLLAVVAIVLGVALLVETAALGGGVVGFALGLLFIGLGVGRLYLPSGGVGSSPANGPQAAAAATRAWSAPDYRPSRRVRRSRRRLYFALGIVALHALGFTPVVLAVVGVLFLIVTMSYAEGTTSIGETGGAATFVRVAFNDFAGFVTGWALFLDYLIVIALSALFFPHYLGLAIGVHSIARHPGDLIVGCVVIAAIAVVRLLRPTRLYSFSLAVPLLDLVTQLLLVLLGFAFLFSPSALTRGLHLGTQPSWHQIAFAFPLALLAYTGLETVANLAEQVRQPGRDLPRSLFTGIGAVVLVTVLIALVALSAFPAQHGTTELGTTWLKAPLMGVVYALGPHIAYWLERVLRVYVGLTGALILLTAAVTSNSGFGRLAFSLAEHGQLPRRFGRLSRRSLHSPRRP